MEKENTTIPSGLFHKAGSKRSDRYLIYRLLNCVVTFRSLDGAKVSGCVDEVYRDIFKEQLRLTIGGKVYRFKEPTAVSQKGKDIVFVYGDAKKQDLTDEKLFSEMRQQQFKETISDTISRITPRRFKMVRFVLGKKIPVRRRMSLMRGIQAEATTPPV